MPPSGWRELVRDYVLRRTKDMVLTDLPPKMFRDAELDLTPEQRATYEMAEDEGVVRLNEMGEQITIQHVFELVLRLKQICNFDPAHRREQQARTAGSRPGRSRRQRQEGDRLQPVGRRRSTCSAEQLARFGPLEYHGKIPSQTARRRSRAVQGRPDQARDPDELRRRQRRAESAVLRLRVPVRPLVEPGRRRSGDQPGPSHRRRRPGHRHADARAQPRSKSGSTRCCEQKRELFASHHRPDRRRRRAPASSQDEIFGLFNLRTPKGPIKAAA